MNKLEETKEKTEGTPLDLKVLICQLNAKQKDIVFNQTRVAKSLESYKASDNIDVILFPEMMFTGYSFTDSADVESYAEEAGKGPTFEYLSKLAKNLKTYVICGYPEVFPDEKAINKKRYYNSLYVIDRSGNLKLNYRKRQLLEADKQWAEEGESFKSVELESSKGIKYKAVVAMGNDINPTKVGGTEKYELAEFCKQEGIDALFVASAWVDTDIASVDSKAIETVINSWLLRLQTLCNLPTVVRYDKQWGLFWANRVGKEGDLIFTGSSHALKLNPAQLIFALDKRKEGFIMAEVSLAK